MFRLIWSSSGASRTPNLPYMTANSVSLQLHTTRKKNQAALQGSTHPAIVQETPMHFIRGTLAQLLLHVTDVQ
jgi:hypothetical protein